MFVKWLMDVNETTLFGDKTVRELTKGSLIRLSDGSFGAVRDILTGDVGFTTEYVITLKDGSVLNLNTESKMTVRCSTTNNTPRTLNIRSIYLLFRHYFDNQERFGRIHRMKIKDLGTGTETIIENVEELCHVKRTILLVEADHEFSGVIVNNRFVLEP